MRKGVMALAAAVLVATLATPAALADKPIKEPVTAEDFTIPASICGFAVDAEIVGNKETTKTFSNGGALITGSLKVRLTNAEDSASSVELNLPGPGHLDEGTLVGRGPWLLFFEAGELPNTPAMLAFVRGRFRIDENGFTLLAGKSVDLCGELRSS